MTFQVLPLAWLIFLSADSWALPITRALIDVNKCLGLWWALQLYCVTLPVYILESGNTLPAEFFVLSVSVVELPFVNWEPSPSCALVRVMAP